MQWIPVEHGRIQCPLHHGNNYDDDIVDVDDVIGCNKGNIGSKFLYLASLRRKIRCQTHDHFTNSHNIAFVSGLYFDGVEHTIESNIDDDILAASDAFFPFVDGIEKLVQAGVKAIIQPGGSVKDQEIIEAAKEKDIAMVFTGRRHFRH